MDKIKVYELAKELDLTSKDILNKAKAMGIDVSSHLSSLELEQADKIRNEFKTGNKNVKMANNEKNKTKEEGKKGSTPVIIRREVIISDEEDKKKKEEEKKKEERKDVGFVERKSNQDYNIVYRNKPQKPLTVSELFGFGKKEEKKEEIVKKEEPKKEEVKPVEQKTVVIEAKEEKVKTENKTNVALNNQ